MATKKSTPAATPARPKTAPGRAPRSAPQADVPEQPAGEDPEQQAHYFMQLLESLAQSGDAEAKKLRIALIDFVAEYRDNAKVDKARAKLVALARMVTFEVSVSEMLLKSTRKISKSLTEQTRRLGTSTAQGKTVRAAAEGFTNLVEALEMMLDSAHKQDLKLREQAHKRLAQVKAVVESLKL